MYWLVNKHHGIVIVVLVVAGVVVAAGIGYIYNTSNVTGLVNKDKLKQTSK